MTLHEYSFRDSHCQELTDVIALGKYQKNKGAIHG